MNQQAVGIFKSLTLSIAILSTLGFSGYFFSTMALGTMHRVDDITTWFFNLMYAEVTYTQWLVLPWFVHGRTFLSGLFCVSMLISYFRLRAEQQISILPYFLPLVLLISHGLGFIFGMITMGWIFDIILSLLAISFITFFYKESKKIRSQTNDRI